MSDLTFRPRTPPMEIMPVWLPEAVFGTTASTASAQRRSICGSVTHDAAGQPDLPGTTAQEVTSLRDSICGPDGLTRVELARSLNVDRRSLSGWTTGEIRPTPERLDALRFVARVIQEVRSTHPGRTREVAVAKGPRGSIVDAIANGLLREPSSWRLFGPGGRRAVTAAITHERTEMPLHAIALAAYLDGELVTPERSTTVRDPSIYEIEPEHADVPYADEPIIRPRRRPYL